MQTKAGYHSSYGYTLIEILVGITIVSIVFISGYIGFREFSRRQGLTSAVRQVVADLRLAQAEASAGRTIDVAICRSPNYLQGYNFRVNSNTSYRVEAQCSAGTSVVKNVDLPASVVLQAPGTNPILFKVLGQGTNLPADTSIVVTVFGLSQTISVSTGGSIE